MSTGTLYFKRSNGEKVFISDNVKKDKIAEAIYKAVADINPRYKIYYIRSWRSSEDPTVTIYDVGSHSEFFLYKDDEKASSN